MTQMNIKKTKIVLDDNVRVVRLGVGKYENKWFVRIDLWSVGYRFTKNTH